MDELKKIRGYRVETILELSMLLTITETAVFLLFMYGCVSLLKAKVMAGKERRADLVV